MKKDTSKIVDLDALFKKASVESTPEKEIITEAKTTSVSKPMLDIEAIVTEWSYRCDKGYPDMKNKSDVIKLQEILDEMGIELPFNRIKLQEATKVSNWNDVTKGTPNEKIFKKLLVANTKQLNFENESIYQSVFDVYAKLSATEQEQVVKNFQKFNVDSFAAGGWKIFEKFFDARGYGGTLPGRGEMMAVLAIKNASSGGSKEKDLQIPGGSWEIKEAPSSIRMAKSGAIGKFEYVDLAKDFYKLLANIKLNNPKSDKILQKNLNKVFTTKEIADKVYTTLINNFRGDAFKPSTEDVVDGDTTTPETFFDRTKTSEWPTGVIDLHYKGFLDLKKAREEVLNNKELINNAKLILRTSKQDDKEFYINPEDSEEIATAKPGAEVKIKVATPAKGDIVEFLQNMLLIMRHPLVKDPSLIPKDFLRVRDSYFDTSNIDGILYYNKGKNKGLDPKPNLGRPKVWIVYGISQGLGKMQLKTTSMKSKTAFLQAQVKLDK